MFKDKKELVFHCKLSELEKCKYSFGGEMLQEMNVYLGGVEIPRFMKKLDQDLNAYSYKSEGAVFGLDFSSLDFSHFNGDEKLTIYSDSYGGPISLIKQ